MAHVCSTGLPGQLFQNSDAFLCFLSLRRIGVFIDWGFAGKKGTHDIGIMWDYIPTQPSFSDTIGAPKRS